MTEQPVESEEDRRIEKILERLRSADMPIQVDARDRLVEALRKPDNTEGVVTAILENVVHWAALLSARTHYEFWQILEPAMIAVSRLGEDSQGERR